MTQEQRRVPCPTRRVVLAYVALVTQEGTVCDILDKASGRRREHMGSMTLSALLPEVPCPVDDAHEVGAIHVRQQASAMCIGWERGPSSPLVYVDETLIAVAMQWRVVEYSGGQHHRWWRLEVKATSMQTAIHKGDELIVAEHPYANGWVQPAPFKTASRKGEMERADPASASFVTPEALIQWIEALPYDFWEKGNYLTAGLSEPELPFMVGAVRNMQKQSLLVFGVCGSARACEEALFASPEARRLLKTTETGTLRFWPTEVEFAVPPARADERLYDEVKAESPSVLWLAIRQALAGPHEESLQWKGHPVMEKVQHIYCGHLFNRYRVLARERGNLDIGENE
jgi:hypothetical protein